jgi:hypothetical protein
MSATPPSIARAESIDYGDFLKGIVANHFVADGTDEATAVATLGGRAFVAGHQFWVINTGVPTAPWTVGHVTLSDQATAIAVSGFYAYVAVGSRGLDIVRIVVPANPTITDRVTVTGSASDVAVEGGYAYVADAGGLKVIDVGSDIGHGTAVGAFGASAGTAVEVSGTTVFLAAPPYLYILDASDPTHVAQRSRIGGSGIRGLTFDGGMLYAIRQANQNLSQLAIYDVSDPANPTEVSSRSLQYPYARAIDAAYPYVYACTAGIWTNMSLETIDVSDPALPTVVGHTAGGFWDVTDVAVEDGIAYVADDIWGLNIVDVSHPRGVPVLSRYPTGDFAEDVALIDHYALVADRGEGLSVIDLIGGGIVAQVPEVADAYNLVLVGNLAYVLGTTGLHLVDVTLPDQPHYLSHTAMPGEYEYDLAVSGNYVFIANGSVNLVVVDATDTAHPVVLSTYPGSIGEARGVDVAWPFVYLGGSWHELAIVDVSDPAHPVGRGAVSSPLQSWGYAGGLAVRGQYAYISDGYSGMWVADVADPDHPVVASVHPNFVTLDCVVRGSILYTARLDLGMQLWDLGPDPSNPQLIGEVDTAGQVYGVDVGPESIVIADEREGLLVVPLHRLTASVPAEEAASRLFTIEPNPTRCPVRVEFRQSTRGSSSVEVLDVAGRRIRLLGSGEIAESGRRSLTWDGRDGMNRPVAAGTYFVRLRGPGMDATRSVVVIR